MAAVGGASSSIKTQMRLCRSSHRWPTVKLCYLIIFVFQLWILEPKLGRLIVLWSADLWVYLKIKISSFQTKDTLHPLAYYRDHLWVLEDLGSGQWDYYTLWYDMDFFPICIIITLRVREKRWLDKSHASSLVTKRGMNPPCWTLKAF